MASIKIILRNEEKADGTYPLAIRITKDRKASYIYLEYAIKATDWDKKTQRVKNSYLNSARLNNYLIKKLSEAMNKALEVETDKADATVRAVRNKIKPKAGETFFAQAESYLSRLKALGKYNQYTSDKPKLKHFRAFLGQDIAFSDITPALLEKFKVYLKSVHKPVRGKGQLNDRSIVNHLVTIRSVFSQAINENVVDAKYYPFGKGKVKIKFPESIKIGLSIEEVKAIEEVELPEPSYHHARNLWLTSFYFAGMRASDVFRLSWSDIQDGRLSYAMGKNNKTGSFKIPEKAQKILDEYKPFQENKTDLIFPELKGCDLKNKFVTQRTISFKLSAIDKFLRNHVAAAAGVDKHLTMHIARHTFGNISGDKIPIQMLQRLYRHSSITTTIGYQQNFIHKETDDALDAVVSFKP